MIKQYGTSIESPIGKITILSNETHITTITFAPEDLSGIAANEICLEGTRQLREYFEGKLQSFSLPLLQSGTDFQQGVWDGLTTIGYGSTISYLRFSEQLKNVLAIRAIAAANGKNNLAIVVPCHRVIGSNGKLVGYAGELWRKQWLLDHEREISRQGQMTLFPNSPPSFSQP